MVINTNTSAIRASRFLAESGSLLSKSLSRLSAGTRIVSPEDDAAGLAQSLKLSTQVKRIEAVMQNNANLVSFLQTQDGFLNKVTQALDRMSEIAVLAKDATKTSQDIALYQAEFDQLQNFINSVYEKKFNGVNLFSDSILHPVIDGQGTTKELAGANLALAVGKGNGEFTINLKFTGGLNDDQKNAFYSAANRWQSIIMKDLVNVGAVDDLEITVTAANIDGPSGTLAQAGPGAIRGGSPSLPVTGSMTFDTSDLNSLTTDGRLYAVILHEMGHVLGIGSLWDTQGLVVTTADGPQYQGQAGVDEYNAIFGTTFSTLPAEDDGGVGTAEVHPEESSNRTISGDAAPGLDNELMTGFAESAGTPMPLSRISIGFLDDLGYTVDYAEADAYSGPGTGTGPRRGISMHDVEKIKMTVQDVSSLRARVGANLADALNRQETLQIEKENLSQATSRISDTDVAKESVQFTKAQILVNSGSAMLSQSNALPEATLRLIGA
ncbi:MAG: flagellin [Verrucomicrobia bacterium]|nr:flagellin [Verrucomicrobiota bacterium]